MQSLWTGLNSGFPRFPIVARRFRLGVTMSMEGLGCRKLAALHETFQLHETIVRRRTSHP